MQIDSASHLESGIFQYRRLVREFARTDATGITCRNTRHLVITFQGRLSSTKFASIVDALVDAIEVFFVEVRTKTRFLEGQELEVFLENLAKREENGLGLED